MVNHKIIRDCIQCINNYFIKKYYAIIKFVLCNKAFEEKFSCKIVFNNFQFADT